MGSGEVAIAGIGFGEGIGVDGHDRIQPQAFYRRLVIGTDARQVAFDHRAAAGASLANGLLCLDDGGADHIEPAAPGLCTGRPAEGEQKKAERSKNAHHRGLTRDNTTACISFSRERATW